MAREDDIDSRSAASALKGLAQKLAAVTNRCADAFIDKADQAADPGEAVEQTMRAVAAIARAALAVHALQAAEDKADERATAARAARAAAAVRTAGRAWPPTLDEGDETDMNDKDPRLDTAEGVAEIRRDAGRGLECFLHRLETKRAQRRDDGGSDGAGVPGVGDELAVESPPVPTPA
jgi:hypothetical protein